METKVVGSEEVREALRVVIDYVERWNKNDYEVKVAEAVMLLANRFDIEL